MKYQLIIEGRELTNVSQDALKWFYGKVLTGNKSPFTCVTINGETKGILLGGIKTSHQMELF